MAATITFEQWMAQVDAAVQRMTGCSAYDLADYLYADAFEDGIPPERAAKAAIAADSGDDDEFYDEYDDDGCDE